MKKNIFLTIVVISALSFLIGMFPMFWGFSVSEKRGGLVIWLANGVIMISMAAWMDNITAKENSVFAEYKANIGKKTHKISKEGTEPKPFKSGFKVNTIKGVIEHPQLKIAAYTFEEDESYVECRRCVIIG